MRPRAVEVEVVLRQDGQVLPEAAEMAETNLTPTDFQVDLLRDHLEVQDGRLKRMGNGIHSSSDLPR